MKAHVPAPAPPQAFTAALPLAGEKIAETLRPILEDGLTAVYGIPVEHDLTSILPDWPVFVSAPAEALGVRAAENQFLVTWRFLP